MGDSNYVSTFNSILIGLCHNDEISELGTKLVNQLTDLLGIYLCKFINY